jgi:hypothetical protein
MVAAPNTFSVYTKSRGLLLQVCSPSILSVSYLRQPTKPKELDQWLEAMDPLLAGSILSKRGMSPKKPM